MTEVFEGGCQCGNISYRVEGESVNLFVCHCTECQKQTSSAFGMALWISNYEIKSLTGQLQSWTRLAPSGQEIMGDSVVVVVRESFTKYRRIKT